MRRSRTISSPCASDPGRTAIAVVRAIESGQCITLFRGRFRVTKIIDVQLHVPPAGLHIEEAKAVEGCAALFESGLQIESLHAVIELHSDLPVAASTGRG